jgi:hypothetical protein
MKRKNIKRKYEHPLLHKSIIGKTMLFDREATKKFYIENGGLLQVHWAGSNWAS